MWLIFIVLVNIAMLASFVWLWPDHKLILLFVEASLLIVLVWLFYQESQARKLIINKLASGFASLNDNDFSMSLPKEKLLSHNRLIQEFNQVVDKLRTERQALYQRELLLDKMANASNVASILLNQRQQLVYLNQAGKQLLSGNNSLLGLEWPAAVKGLQPELLELPNKTSAIVSLSLQPQTEQEWLLSTHAFRLHGASHKLILLKPITNELQAQETQVWKKVIRVINHELNNSIAPISSMCHSGNILAEQLAHPQLNRVFDTISSRINKLSEFIDSYSRLARISQPQRQVFNLISSLNSLQQLYSFELKTEQTELSISADPAQLEQVFINVIKNAIEANQVANASVLVQVTLELLDNSFVLRIIDAGSGMTEQQLVQAFLPSFSTKQHGSGIGLAVCKEIIDNHNGQIELLNNLDSGLTVEITLPLN